MKFIYISKFIDFFLKIRGIFLYTMRKVKKLLKIIFHSQQVHVAICQDFYD